MLCLRVCLVGTHHRDYIRYIRIRLRSHSPYTLTHYSSWDVYTNSLSITFFLCNPITSFKIFIYKIVHLLVCLSIYSQSIKGNKCLNVCMCVRAFDLCMFHCMFQKYLSLPNYFWYKTHTHTHLYLYTITFTQLQMLPVRTVYFYTHVMAKWEHVCTDTVVGEKYEDNTWILFTFF